MILARDPSSTCTGYALLGDARRLVEAGVLSPVDAKAAPIVRIGLMMDQLAALIEEHKPERVIIEITSGKIAGRLRGSGMDGAGLGVYGMGVGAMYAVARLAVGDDCVVPIEENRWTRQVGKGIRHRATAERFPKHRGAILKDHNMADAIGLGVWWFDTQAMERAFAAPVE